MSRFGKFSFIAMNVSADLGNLGTNSYKCSAELGILETNVQIFGELWAEQRYLSADWYWSADLGNISMNVSGITSLTRVFA